MKTLLILSSRTTAIGTLRKDSIRELDDKDHRVATVINNLTKGENPAAKILTDKEVKEHAKRIKTLVPKAEGKPATIKVKEAQAGEAAANERAEKAVTAEATAKTATEEALGREKDALKASEEAQEREAAALIAMEEAKAGEAEAIKLAEEREAKVVALMADHKIFSQKFEALQAELAELKKAPAK